LYPRGAAFYLPKLTLVFLLWLSALTMEITQEVNQVGRVNLGGWSLVNQGVWSMVNQ
jgi:hypothetical protein